MSHSRIESSIGLPVYKTHMKLTIINISSGDDGIYKCVAKNPRGETDGIIRLYGKHRPITWNLLKTIHRIYLQVI